MRIVASLACSEEVDIDFLVLDGLDDAIVVTGHDKVILRANHAALKFYGPKLIGQRLDEVFQTHGCAISSANLDEARKAPWTGTCIHETKAGERLSVEWSIKWVAVEPPFFLSVSRHIPEKPTSPEEGKDRTCLRALVAALPDSALFVDANYRIVFANQALAKSLGATVSELEGELAVQRFPGALAEARTAQFKEAKRLRRAVQFEDERAGRHFVSTISPVFDSCGKFEGAAIFSMDITEFKTAHRRRLELEERLSQSERLESIGRLAGGIAHDFNNLLMGILGFTELSLNEIESSHPVHANLKSIQEAGEHATDLTRRLLTFSRRQVVETRVVDLNVLVHETQVLLSRVIGEDVELSFLPMEHQALVKIDPTQVNQILMNLATNARDAMPDGGRLIIELNPVVVDEPFARLHPGLLEGQHIQLSVSDSGIGMPAEAIEKAFEPFFTTKARDRGTGLGLATVHGIVNQSGGAVAIYSEVDVGTTFKIYLPQREGAPDPPPSKAPPHNFRFDSELTILLVEDDALVREVARSILEKAGFLVIEAPNGQSAIDVFEKDNAVSILLTDVIMPDMNGKELFRRLKLLRPELECVFMSGYTDHVIVPHGALEPDVAFLEKPFSAESLIRKIHERLAPKSLS